MSTAVAEPVPPPPPDGGRRRGPRGAGWLLVAVGAGIALLGTAAGATAIVGPLVRSDAAGGESFTGVRSAEVVSDCPGDVDVTTGPGGGDGGPARVAWRDRTAFGAPEHRQVLTGGVLRVEVDCPPVGAGWGPASDLALVVPSAAPVSVTTASGDVSAAGLGAAGALETGSGDVRVEGATGGLRLVTGSGSVRAEGVSGGLVARTGSGDVVATGVAGGAVDVETGSGDVAVEAVRAPSSVAGSTGSGELEVVLPDDGRPWAVDATSDSGEVVVEVADDPAAGRAVVLGTGSGDVAVRLGD